MKWRVPFALHQNFLDPELTDDGQLYGPFRYKEIVKECYLLAKNCNLPYSDLMLMTPTERSYMLEFLAEEIKKSNDLIEQRKQQK